MSRKHRQRITEDNIPKGYYFGGIACGIKPSKKEDLGMIYSDIPAVVSGTFTANQVVAAPVLLCKKHMKKGLCSVVLVNSGNANACTGLQGIKDSRDMARCAAKYMCVDESQVMVSSTGKIGTPLPMKKILSGIACVSRNLESSFFGLFSKAIMTTDLFPKISCRSVRLHGKEVRILGIAKGAGMIAPQLKSHRGSLHATMLAYLLTDAVIERNSLDVLARKGSDYSFNRVTVDGDMSTNDTLLLLANGKAGNQPLTGRSGGIFEKAVFDVLEELAKMMVMDGEGATKCVKIHLHRARTAGEARKLATVVGDSLLVKTAFFGGDPNWGRILAALGRSGVKINPSKVMISIGDVPVFRNSVPMGSQYESRAAAEMKKSEFTVDIDMGSGTVSDWIFTSDLTHAYVSINSEYRT